DHADRENRDDDDARNRLRWLDDLIAEVTDVVVTEIVVDRDEERGAEAGEAAGAIEPRRRPERERAQFQVRKAGADHDRQRPEDADPEEDRELADRFDAAQQ